MHFVNAVYLNCPRNFENFKIQHKHSTINKSNKFLKKYKWKSYSVQHFGAFFKEQYNANL